jgi:hypothetical protein
MGVEPYRFRGFTSEVSPAYDIFHYVLKRAKSNRCVCIELLVKPITGWI